MKTRSMRAVLSSIIFILLCCNIPALLTGCVQQRSPTSYFNVEAPAGNATVIRRTLMSYLDTQGVEVIPREGTLRLLLPTDNFFIGQTNEVDLDCLPILAAVARLIQTYTCCGVPYVWVTAYTDEIGTTKAKKERSTQQAQVIASFLWAHGVPAHIMGIEGWGDKGRISSDRIVGGSADNRRIEIGIPEQFFIDGW